MRDLAWTFMLWALAIGLAGIIIEILAVIAFGIYFEFFGWRRKR